MGLELVPTVSGIDGIVGLAETTDGSIIALGQDFDAVKLDHGGFFDQSFGNNGIALNVASSAVYGTSLALAPDGNIYAAGGTTYGSDSQMVISRLLSSGKLDNKFGTNGIVKVSLSGKSTVFAIALQDNGAIVAAGDVQNGLIANNVAVVRLVGSDTSPPVLVNPSVPALDPNSDTGMKGDGSRRSRGRHSSAQARTPAGSLSSTTARPQPSSGRQRPTPMGRTPSCRRLP